MPYKPAEWFGSLSVVQANIQHKKSALDALWMYMVKEDVDVALVQEPYVLGENHLPGMPAVYARAIAPKPRDDEGVVIGMQLACIVYKQALPMMQDGELTSRGTVAAVLKSNPPMLLVSAYLPRSSNIEHETRKWVSSGNWVRHKTRALIGCDANAHSPMWWLLLHGHNRRTLNKIIIIIIMWCSTTRDRWGREIEDFIIEQGLGVANRPSAFTTFDGARGGGPQI